MLLRDRLPPNERRLAALAASGAFGLDYINTPRWVRARGVPLAWQIPPAVRRRYRDQMHLVTSDATSSVFIPQSSSEWTTFNALNGWANPAHLYLLQESSGNAADSIGSATLTASATAPLYHQAVTGWSTLAVGFTDNTLNQRFLNTSGMVDISTTSMLALGYCAFAATQTSALNSIFTFGTTSNFCRTSLNTTPRFRVDSVGNGQVGTGTVGTGVHAFVLKCDRTNTTVTNYTLVDKLTPTFASGMTGNQFALGAYSNGSQRTCGFNCLYLAIWTGSNAEKSDADVKNLIVQLGNTHFTPNWTAAYTASLSETDSLSESVAALFAVNIALSETDNLSESTNALAAFTQGVSESESLTESLAAATSTAQALSESESLAESLASTYAAIESVSESASLADSLDAVYATTQGLSESASLDESLDSSSAFTQALSDTNTLAESTTVVMAAAPSLADSHSLDDVLLALAGANTSLAEALSSTEAVTAIRGVVESLSETTFLSEALSALFHAAPALTDTLGTAESIVTAFTAVIPFAPETLTIAELLYAIEHLEGDLGGTLQAVGALLGALVAASPLGGTLVRRN